MQKTILISGTYPILDEKLNDLLGRSYDIAALEQPFPVNARKFGWVEAVVVYVPYCGEPEDAAAAWPASTTRIWPPCSPASGCTAPC